MILSSLAELYERYQEDPDVDVPARFWSREKAACRICLNEEGEVLAVIPYAETVGKGTRKYRVMEVPEHQGRTSAPKPYFLCDTAAYLFGMDEKKGAQKFALSCKLHEQVLHGCESPAAQAVLRFFEDADRSNRLGEQQHELLSEGGFCVFEFEPKQGNSILVHADPEVRDAWEKHCVETSQEEAESAGVIGQCSVTGERAPLARLFPQVTGFVGANSAGASLVSFNLDAFESYGKKQAYNASISEQAAFESGQALRALLSDEHHRIRLGDDVTMVFWSDSPDEQEDECVFAMASGWFVDDEGKPAEDVRTLQKISDIARAMKSGNPIPDYDVNNGYHLLGLSPNAARLSVRFYFEETFGQLALNFDQYQQDIAMDGVKTTSLWRLLQQTKAPGRTSKLPSTLVHASYRAMFTGGDFPRALMDLIISRMRADHASRNVWDMGERAAVLKACLARRWRLSGEAAHADKEVTMALNRDNTDIGYLLGRLFAVLERAQETAIGGDINATIRDKYIGSASTTPARVFPGILRNAQNHLSKISKGSKGNAIFLDKLIGEIINAINGDTGAFPATLSIEEQGMFYIGYYQQRQVFFTPKSKADPESSAENA
jgi:CRISPR-associated protein Csd1